MATVFADYPSPRRWPDEGVARIPYWVYSERPGICGNRWARVRRRGSHGHGNGDSGVLQTLPPRHGFLIPQHKQRPTMSPQDLRFEVEEMYYDYVECLDDDQLERWPEFFTDDCVYKIIPREN